MGTISNCVFYLARNSLLAPMIHIKNDEMIIDSCALFPRSWVRPFWKWLFIKTPKGQSYRYQMH